jgi:hypothetical protein
LLLFPVALFTQHGEAFISTMLMMHFQPICIATGEQQSLMTSKAFSQVAIPCVVLFPPKMHKQHSPLSPKQYTNPSKGVLPHSLGLVTRGPWSGRPWVACKPCGDPKPALNMFTVLCQINASKQGKFPTRRTSCYFGYMQETFADAYFQFFQSLPP